MQLTYPNSTPSTTRRSPSPFQPVIPLWIFSQLHFCNLCHSTQGTEALFITPNSLTILEKHAYHTLYPVKPSSISQLSQNIASPHPRGRLHISKLANNKQNQKAPVYSFLPYILTSAESTSALTIKYTTSWIHGLLLPTKSSTASLSWPGD